MSDLNLAQINTVDALNALPPAYLRDVRRAYVAASDLEPSAARVRRAAVAVGTLRNRGASVRNVVKLLSLYGEGTLPTSKGSIERLGYVADAISGEWPNVGDCADAILMSIYRIAQHGRAADVARAAELGRAAANGDDALAAIDAIKAELNRERHREIVAAPDRPVAGIAREAGLPADTEHDDDDTQPTVADVARQALSSSALASASVLALVAELHKRVTARGFTPDQVIDDAWTELGMAYESASLATFAGHLTDA
jgi:hypothetical protein